MAWCAAPSCEFQSANFSQSPKAGQNKTGRWDFRKSAIRSRYGEYAENAKRPEKQGPEEIPRSKDADNADAKTQKMRLTGFNVTGFGRPQIWWILT